MSRTTLVDHYNVLGVAYTAPIDEIKKVYRKLSRLVHPDVADLDEIPDAAEQFKAISFAYEVLSNDDKRQALDKALGINDRRYDDDYESYWTEPTPQDHPVNRTEVINGVTFVIKVTYRFHWYTETVQIRFSDVYKVVGLPNESVHFMDYVLVDDQGQVLTRTYSSFTRLLQATDEAERAQRRALRTREYQAQIDALKVRCEKLILKGMPTAHLTLLITRATNTLERTNWPFRPTSFETVMLKLREASKEAERLETGDAELLVTELLLGRITHPDIAGNQETMTLINAASIQSNGFVEAFTEDHLADFYRSRLQGTTSVYDLSGRNLKLRLDDYAPADVLQELNLAPAVLKVKGRRGNVTYPVTYCFDDVDGTSCATGVITIPLGIFEVNAADYGKTSAFPSLPFGITLIVEVTDNDKVVARGKADIALTSKVDKYKRGKRRSGSFESTDTFGGKRRAPITPEAPPPWYKGARLR